jgi:3-oxoacyl-[acyl-carrier-protein] synthase III
MMHDVFITALGKFLPGAAISNAEMEDYLGRIGGKASRVKDRILKQNGIQTRYYALDKNQKSLYLNSDMAANAIRDALNHSDIHLNELDYMAVATSQGDLVLPGFASMVHGNLKNPACEIASLHGICSSGVQAMKSAFLQVQNGEKKNAVACASEFSSRLFKASRFENQFAAEDGNSLPFDTEFLRWMLSDGAGAAVFQNHPNATGLSLKVEWIKLKSYANRYDTCMYCGANKDEGGDITQTWIDYNSFTEAAEDGAINLKQDIRLLDNMVRIGVEMLFDLIDEKMVQPDAIDHLLCHYSSHFFKGEILKLMEKGGCVIPEEKWFTNLYTKGNTGAASIFIMLEELFNERPLRVGETILCMVPESGRFISSYMLLTVVAPKHSSVPVQTEMKIPEPMAPELHAKFNPEAEWLVRQLTKVWLEFEGAMNDVPIISKLNRGHFTVEDYKSLLLNMRQQVMEGARWISRAASSITIEGFELRSVFIGHAKEEHRDYQLLERDYVSVGGYLEEITAGQKNLGSEALSAWMFHQASRENPFDLLGAMYIIEGVGNRLAKRWGEMIKLQLGLEDKQVSFLLYHGANDENHFDKLESAVNSDMLTRPIAERILKTAKVTARLYRLQLEEVGNW